MTFHDFQGQKSIRLSELVIGEENSNYKSLC